MAIDTIRVNGNQYSWGSIVLKVDDETLYGFTGLSYNQKRERTKAYGAGAHHAPRGRSAGKYSAEAKLTGWRGSMQALRAKLAAKASDGASYGNVEFQIVAEYVSNDGSEEPITVEVVDCVIASEDISDEEGPDPLKEEIGIDCMYIKKNGLTLFDNSDGAR